VALFAVALFAVALFAVALFAVAFLAVGFFAVALFAVAFLAVDFFAVGFLAVAFRAAGFAVVLFVVVLLPPLFVGMVASHNPHPRLNLSWRPSTAWQRAVGDRGDRDLGDRGGPVRIAGQASQGWRA